MILSDWAAPFNRGWAFRSGRDFSAWIGLVPKQNSSGSKDKLGSISKQGDRYLRRLFTAGPLALGLTVPETLLATADEVIQ
jgi:transposase